MNQLLKLLVLRPLPIRVLIVQLLNGFGYGLNVPPLKCAQYVINNFLCNDFAYCIIWRANTVSAEFNVFKDRLEWLVLANQNSVSCRLKRLTSILQPLASATRTQIGMLTMWREVALQ